MTECQWSPCDQQILGSGNFCYFHRKRAEDLISGYVPGPGLTTYREPSAEVKALIAALEKEDE